MSSIGGSPPLRARRIGLGLTQDELARRAGVSRQLIAAVEGGRNRPTVDAAIRLARALSTTVEALFATPAPPVRSAFGDPLRDGMRLRAGRVGDRIVAAALPDRGTIAGGWANPDGVLEGGALHLFADANLDGLVLAGCDPALAVVEVMLAGRGTASVTVLSAATDTALAALVGGNVHAAVVHGPEGTLPRPDLPLVRLHLASWQVGLALAPGVRARTVEALLAEGVAIVQREPGAASQQALERAAAAVGVRTPSGARAAGHLDAARTAQMMGSAAVTTEAAAHAFGLRFASLEHHTVEIWFAAQWLAHPAVQALVEVVSSAAFIERVAAFGGYDLSACGAWLTDR